MNVKLAISVTLARLAFIFVYQNTGMVQVNFLIWSIDMSLVVLVFIMLGVGMAISWLLGSYLRFARKRSQVKATKTE